MKYERQKGRVSNSSMQQRILNFKANVSGVAMVEFALCIPFFMSLTMVGAELANYSTATMRVNQLALAISDVASRTRPTIDEADINDIMIGARLMGQPIDLANRGRIIVSALEENGLAAPNAGQRITWQRCFGAANLPSTFGVQGAGTTNASLATGMGPAGNRVIAPTGTVIMYVQVRYRYRPLISQDIANLIPAINTSNEISQVATFVVRERLNSTLTDGSGMIAAATARTCNRFTAV
jgi:hypothetical protein